MYKELVISLIIIIAIVMGNTVTQNYTKQAVAELSNNLNELKEKISQDDENINWEDVEIQIEDVLVGSIARLYMLDNYLIIMDPRSDDMSVHFFNKMNYEYETSSIQRGQGPGEITNMGYIGVNKNKKELYISDHGKLKIFNYPLDSIIDNAFYKPEVKKEINNIQFPSDYVFINDTLSFARII